MTAKMRSVAEWVGPVQLATALQCGLCSDGDTVGVTLYAKDGDAFAHAHMELAEAERFMNDFTESVGQLRAQLGFKPQ